MIVCSRCSKENQDHYKFCLGCGAELPRESSKPKAFSAPTPPGGSPKVGTGTKPPRRMQAAEALVAAEPVAQAREVDPPRPVQAVRSKPAAAVEALPQELAPLAEEAQPCVNCGAQVPENFRFCHVCGHDLHAAPATNVRSDVPQERVSAPAVAAAPQRSVARAKLILIQPDGSEGEAFPLEDGSTLIGRSTGGIFANDAYLSPEHSEFRFEGDQLVVKDMESLNGIYIRVEAEVPIELFDGSVFRVGQEILRFEAPTAPDPAPDGTQLMGSPHQGFLGRVCLVIGRETTGNCFPIPPAGIHLGRERGDVVFPEDGYVSGLHCRIHSEVGHVFLTDLGSSNGTFVRVLNESFVPKGTFVLMGQQLFRADY
jgi:pSer/pThr/pTyr-binding forkhead associated (FHA) protein